MYANERIANVEARFLPMTEDWERPCLVIGGVQVYAYFDQGRMVISLDIDSDAYPEFLDGQELPYVFTVNDEKRDSSTTEPLGHPEHPHDAGDYSDVQ